jgi:hypothetical protein
MGILDSLNGDQDRQRLQLLADQYKAIGDQLLTEQNPVMRPLLETQQKQIEAKIAAQAGAKPLLWNKERKKEFRKALQECYGDYGKLKVFVGGELGENLPNIVGDQNMTVACYELIEWGCAKRRIDELFAAFVSENPRHPLASSGSAPSIAPSGESVGGSGVLRRLERERLEKELAMLIKQYEAVSERLNATQSLMTRVLPEQQLEELGVKIAAIEQRLQEL